MKRNVMLTIASLVSILLLTFHLSSDIIRGMEKGGLSNLVAVPILVVWLYGTLVLAERRSGYAITLLGSLLGLGVPVIHMSGAGVGAQVARAPSGGFFFVWTLIALGVTALFSVILSARGLWSPKWASHGSPTTRTWLILAIVTSNLATLQYSASSFVYTGRGMSWRA